ncbi:MAG: GGDEF domain-containing protein [Hyphomonadaceae bacterium]|nr:GGDEF domain-containing protein [Hyphomonadaceae bacterium]
MRLTRHRAPADGQDPFERRFGLKRGRLPPAVRAAVDTLMAETSMLAQENADLLDKLAIAQALADRDPLVPVFNRRALLRELKRVISYIERYRTQAAVLFLDMDGFKAINDNFGHAVGDAALAHVARLLLQQVRDSDIVGRVGGDEFAVVLANAPAEEARRKAQGLTALIAETPFVHEGVRHRLAASIGVHAFTGAGVEDAETLIARADEAMFAAKHAARARLAVG